MNRQLIDKLVLTAMISACIIGFGPTALALEGPPEKCTPQSTSKRLKRVTLDLANADLVYVVKILAREMGRNVFIGPGVEGSVTIQLEDVPADAALAMVLKQQGDHLAYKLIGYNTLIVATLDRVHSMEEEILGRNFHPKPLGSVRQEILLERAPAARVIHALQVQYKEVEFIPHPTMNGFYVVGKRTDILKIKNEVPGLDR